jgi:2-polyprenyl-3-methyl-5-hydroxy-6-metoxy-1,4-benzoquinol methylase
MTYRDGRLRNLPHRMRLRSVLSLLNTIDFRGKSYADVGCSNGYITSIVNRTYRPASAWGLDHNQANLERARTLHAGIRFELVNLERPITGDPPAYDIVTCFETLEHVGNLEVAVENLIRITRPGGVLIMSAPIEVGARGVLKFAAKVALGYRLNELPQSPHIYRSYILSLLTGKRMSVFRDMRSGWGTHFGFDCRDLDDILASRQVPFHAWNDFTTRLYQATPKETKARSELLALD